MNSYKCNDILKLAVIVILICSTLSADKDKKLECYKFQCDDVINCTDKTTQCITQPKMTTIQPNVTQLNMTTTEATTTTQSMTTTQPMTTAQPNVTQPSMPNCTNQKSKCKNVFNCQPDKCHCTLTTICQKRDSFECYNLASSRCERQTSECKNVTICKKQTTQRCDDYDGYGDPVCVKSINGPNKATDYKDCMDRYLAEEEQKKYGKKKFFFCDTNKCNDKKFKNGSYRLNPSCFGLLTTSLLVFGISSSWYIISNGNGGGSGGRIG